MPRLGVRAYLFLGLGVIVALPTGILGWSQSERWAEAELGAADRENRLLAGELGHQLGDLVEGSTRSVELLAGHVQVLEHRRPERLQRLVDAFIDRSQHMGIAYIADARAVSIATAPSHSADGTANAGVDYSDRDYAIAVLRTGRTSLSRVHLGRRSGRPNLQIAAPYLDAGGALAGFAEGSLELDVLDQIARRVTTTSPGLRVVITDPRGRVLSDTADRLGTLTTTDAALFAPPAGARTEVRSGADLRGEPMRAAAARVTTRGIDWTVTVSRPLASIRARADSAKSQTVAVAATLLAITLALAFLWVHWSSRPLAKLAAAATAVGHGELSTELPEPRALEPRETVELLIAVRDMVDRLRAQRDRTGALIEELEEANDRLRPLATSIEHAVDAIEIATTTGHLLYVNPAWCKLTGYTLEEAVGRTPAELVRSDRNDPAIFADAEDTINSGEVWRADFFGRRKDDSLYEVAVAVSPVMDETGQITHHVAIKRDITGRRKTEEALRLSDRIASVGTLAAGVAHEINNPLTYIMANVAFLQDTIASLPGIADDEREDAIDAAGEAYVGLERVTEIVRGLKQLSRGDEETVSSVDINTLLESCIRMANTEIRHRAQLERDYGAIPQVLANEAKLSQVFLNLVVNAAQAIEVGHAADNTITVTTRSDGDAGVAIEVRDTGKGMDPAELQRIFDPFYTTKPVGVGTGLGLSICHSIVHQLGGRIAVESTPGEGTVFRVTLPVGRPADDAGPETVEAAGEAAPSIRVLVIDDDAPVGRALRRILRDCDVVVTHHARGAREALAGPPFDVVLCDVMMPETSGLELFHELCADRPELEGRFVFITGGIFSPELRRSIAALGAPCLDKPINREQLRATLRVVRDRDAVGPTRAPTSPAAVGE